MTFKHIAFEDSTTMRSLARVAKEKGWLPEEKPLEKTAAKTSDLTPSDSLTENLLKLCDGLRTSGFVAQAEELENKFFTYKQAATLYGVGGEKGEDLIDAAHPKGSHKLEDVDSTEATVETIIDKHLKGVEVATKNPTGKLASSQDILNAVKTVLGQVTPPLSKSVTKPIDKMDAKELQEDIQNDMNIVNKNLDRIAEQVNKELTFSIQQYQDSIQELTQSPTIDNLKEIQSLLSKLHTRLDPSSWLHYSTFGATGLSEDTWSGIQGLLKSTDDAIKDASSKRTALKKLQSEQSIDTTNVPVPPTSQVSSPLLVPAKNLIKALKDEIQKYINNVNYFKPSSQSRQLEFLNGLNNFIDEQDGSINKLPPNNVTEEIVQNYLGKLQEVKQSLDGYGSKKPWAVK